MMSGTSTAVEFEITDAGTRVTVQKLLTPRGQLAEIAAPSEPGTVDSCRMDALAVESLAWQEPDLFEDLVGDPEYRPPIRRSVTDSDTIVESFDLSNEYADTHIRKIRTSEGDRLQVQAPVAGFELLADARGLQALATQDPGLFSQFLETPHGPPDH